MFGTDAAFARRRLTTKLTVSSSLLAQAHDRLKGDLTVLWKGEAVAEPKLIEVAIRNTGKEAIIKDDYDVPITVEITSGRILEATVRTSDPNEAAESSDLSVAEDGLKVIVEPGL